VHLAARRAREINAYYHSLGEGLGQYTPPLVDQVDSNKPLSIALEEIAAEKIVPSYPGDARRTAEELLGGERLQAGGGEAATPAEPGGEVVALSSEAAADDARPDDGAASDEP
jgi:DNA-directed RNA polymerase subunit omega